MAAWSPMLGPTTCRALRSGGRMRLQQCRAAASAAAAQRDSLTITRPDDWHLHVRDGAGLASVVPHTAATFGRAVIMPNLQPPLTSVSQVCATSSCTMHCRLWGVYWNRGDDSPVSLISLRVFEMTTVRQQHACASMTESGVAQSKRSTLVGVKRSFLTALCRRWTTGNASRRLCPPAATSRRS